MQKSIKQMVYKPTPKHTVIKKVESPRKEVTWIDVANFLGDKAWDHRGFLLISFIILENVLLLVNR